MKSARGSTSKKVCMRGLDDRKSIHTDVRLLKCKWFDVMNRDLLRQYIPVVDNIFTYKENSKKLA